MYTWVLVKNSIIVSVIQCSEAPRNGLWIPYPEYCDLGGPRNIAGRSITDFDAYGNFKEPQ